MDGRERQGDGRRWMAGDSSLGMAGGWQEGGRRVAGGWQQGMDCTGMDGTGMDGTGMAEGMAAWGHS